MTRARAKTIQVGVNSFLAMCKFTLLPHSYHHMLNALRCELKTTWQSRMDHEAEAREEEKKRRKQISMCSPDVAAQAQMIRALSDHDMTQVSRIHGPCPRRSPAPSFYGAHRTHIWATLKMVRVTQLYGTWDEKPRHHQFTTELLAFGSDDPALRVQPLSSSSPILLHLAPCPHIVTGYNQESTIKNDVKTWGKHDRHHLVQLEYEQDKVLTLIDFLFYQSQGGCWEIVLKDGKSYHQGVYQVSSLIVLFLESSNICIIDIIFLGCYLYFILARFYN
jgi:hypothetical protein